MNKFWTCPKCHRKFENRNQSHSCNIYPIHKHFNRKEKAKELYNELINRLRDTLKFRIDSVECCIHLVSTFTFTGVYILKDKIRLTFSLDHKISSSRIRRYLQMSKNRHMYEIEVKEKRDINKELINWLNQSYNLKKKN